MCLLMAISILLWFWDPFKLHTSPKPELIVVNSQNAVKANGHNILYFSELTSDSILTDITTDADSIHYAPRIIMSSPITNRIIVKTGNYVRKEIKTLKCKLAEVDYYMNVHDVQDEGFDIVASESEIIKKRLANYKRILVLIDSIDSMRIDFKHLTRKGYQNWNIFVGMHGGTWKNGIWMYRKRQGRGLSEDHHHRMISGEWDADTLVTAAWTDSTESYTGQIAPCGCPAGHGYSSDYKESRYEGHWVNGARSGFGMCITKDKLRVGEWKADRWCGERINYTSERIYGIDISRYQHGRNKRRPLSINWSKLRITHLGNISKKHISGTVNYPISFIYIKSTEGISMRNIFYRADYNQARKHGFHVGAYHFFSTRTSGAVQAHFFLRNSKFSRGDLPPVLDVEPLPSQIRKMGGVSAMFRSIRTWMNIVKAHTGVKPVLYISQIFVNRYLSSAPDIKQNYNIWIARYGEYKPDVRLVYWQLCPDGNVRGIHGAVDINVFNGHHSQFEKFLREETIK